MSTWGDPHREHTSWSPGSTRRNGKQTFLDQVFQQAQAAFQASLAVHPAPPPPAPEDHPEAVPDIEVGRYALRTFRVNRQHKKLMSLFQHHDWENGTAIATCRRSVEGWGPHEVPAENCTCGLYGTLTLQQLEHEYRFQAKRCVAVFAAEGTTFIGTKGLRTAAARIVAYWCWDEADALVFAHQCPDATRFLGIHLMLAQYGFPEYEEAWPPQPSPIDEYIPPSQNTLQPDPRYVKYPPQGYGLGVYGNNVASLMSAATPAGVWVVQQLMAGKINIDSTKINTDTA